MLLVLFLLIVGALGLLFLKLKLDLQISLSKLKSIPGITYLHMFHLFLDKNAPNPFANPHSVEPFFDKFCKGGKLTKHEGLFHITAGSTIQLITCDPEVIKEVFVTNSKHIARTEAFHNAFSYKGVKNVATANGEEWKKHRTLLNTAFSEGNLKIILEHKIPSLVTEYIEKWKQREGKPIPMTEEMKCFTLDVILQTGFGAHISATEKVKLSRAIAIYLQRIFVKFFLPNYVIDFPLPFFQQLKNAYTIWITYCIDIINEKISSQLESGNILAEMIRANESGTLTKDELISNSNIFTFAGHDTTKNTLLWALWFIAQHKSVQDKLRQEVTPLFEDNADCILSYDTIMSSDKMKYTRAVIHETLRLKSPVPSVAAEVLHDFTIKTSHGNYFIPKSSIILPMFMQLHNDTTIWGDNTSDFVPERHLTQEYHLNFIPFNIGPRACLGRRFSEMEMYYLIARIVYEFELSTPQNQLEEEMAFTLQPKGEVFITFARNY